jgi:hypothetical protein
MTPARARESIRRMAERLDTILGEVCFNLIKTLSVNSLSMIQVDAQSRGDYMTLYRSSTCSK